jgi:integrase
LKYDRSERVRYLDEEKEQQLRVALRNREYELRKGRERFNAWRVTRHKTPLPMRDHEYVDHLTPIVLLALNTGLRRGELFSLQWKDVNLKTKWLTVAGKTSKSKHPAAIVHALPSEVRSRRWRSRLGLRVCSSTSIVRSHPQSPKGFSSRTSSMKSRKAAGIWRRLE